MPTPVLVPTAALAPGACFLSGDFNGPFIDTGRSTRETGRIYLSVKAVGPLMREVGWIPADEAQKQLDELDGRTAEAEWNAERAGLYDALVEAVSPLLPTPEPIVKQVGVVQDPELLTTIEQLKAKIAGKLAGLEDALAAAQPAPDAAEPAPRSEGSASSERGSAATTVTVNGSEVDLDALLSETAATVKSVVEGWPDEALEEVVLAELERDQPRKTITGLVQ